MLGVLSLLLFESAETPINFGYRELNMYKYQRSKNAFGLLVPRYWLMGGCILLLICINNSLMELDPNNFII